MHMNLIEMNTIKKTVTMSLDEFKKIAKFSEIKESPDEVVAALQKSKPSMVIILESDFSGQSEDMGLEYYIGCPMCKNVVGRIDEDDCYEFWANYCPECGQAIDKTEVNIPC